MKKIVVDTLGADLGAMPIIKGVVKALVENQNLGVVFVGRAADVTQGIRGTDIAVERVEIIDTDEFITNEDTPTCIFGGKEHTSMVLALEKLKSDDECIGLISAGNTGVLLVGSILKVGLAGGIKMPALSAALPTVTGGMMCLVDCGANIDCRAVDFAAYAVMGDAFMRSMYGTIKPKVAIMSVGREKGKGTELVRDAYDLISRLPLNFIGNAEGNDLTSGYADVVVTDGFSGNVLLKNTEAVGKSVITMIDKLPEEIRNSHAAKVIKEEIFKNYDLNSQAGATFLGTAKTIVKMHGCATFDTAYACFNQVIRLESKNFAASVKESLKLIAK